MRLLFQNWIESTNRTMFHDISEYAKLPNSVSVGLIPVRSTKLVWQILTALPILGWRHETAELKITMSVSIWV